MDAAEKYDMLELCRACMGACKNWLNLEVGSVKSSRLAAASAEQGSPSHRDPSRNLSVRDLEQLATLAWIGISGSLLVTATFHVGCGTFSLNPKP